MKLQAQRVGIIESLEEKIGKGFWRKEMVCENDSCYAVDDGTYFFPDHFERNVEDEDSAVTSFFFNRIVRVKDFQTHRYEWTQSSCPDLIRILAEKNDGEFDAHYRNESANCMMSMLVRGNTIKIEGRCFDVDRYKVVYVRAKPPHRLRARRVH